MTPLLTRVLLPVLIDVFLEVIGLGELNNYAEYLIQIRESLADKDLSVLIHLAPPCLVVHFTTIQGVLMCLTSDRGSDLTSVDVIRTPPISRQL